MDASENLDRRQDAQPGWRNTARLPRNTTTAGRAKTAIGRGAVGPWSGPGREVVGVRLETQVSMAQSLNAYQPSKTQMRGKGTPQENVRRGRTW